MAPGGEDEGGTYEPSPGSGSGSGGGSKPGHGGGGSGLGSGSTATLPPRAVAGAGGNETSGAKPARAPSCSFGGAVVWALDLIRALLMVMLGNIAKLRQRFSFVRSLDQRAGTPDPIILLNLMEGTVHPYSRSDSIHAWICVTVFDSLCEALHSLHVIRLIGRLMQ